MPMVQLADEDGDGLHVRQHRNHDAWQTKGHVSPVWQAGHLTGKSPTPPPPHPPPPLLASAIGSPGGVVDEDVNAITKLCLRCRKGACAVFFGGDVTAHPQRDIGSRHLQALDGTADAATQQLPRHL